MQDELDPEVRLILLDHIVRQSTHCLLYERMAEELYGAEPQNSVMRRRMEANAVGTSLNAKLMKLKYANGPDLFFGVNQVNNTFHGDIQAGAFSVSGDADNSGNVTNIFDNKTVEVLQSKLFQAQNEVGKLDIDADIKKIVLDHLKEAASNPTPGLVERALKSLKTVEETIKAVGGIGAGISTIIGAIKIAIGA